MLPNPTPTLASRCIELRTARGWTQKDVARYTGLTQGQISHIETARVTKSAPRTVEKLARLFGVTPDYLTGGAQ